MITQEKYIILNEITTRTLKEELCIINFNIVKSENSLKQLISNNKSTTFWCSTKDFSKQYVETASRLGIKNVIGFPIKTELIETFFSGNSFAVNRDLFSNYEKLTDSKILIVDDNELNISLLEEILSDTGAGIVSFTNPEDAVSEINETEFDLCLLDILMPEMSGFELAEKIKKSLLNKDTPLIFISAISGDENILNGYNAGAYSYIEKPFSPRIIKAQIYNILKAKENETNKLRENDSFVATLTHDLKSPINAEILAIKYMMERVKNGYEAYVPEILSELLSSAKYMKLITDKILCHYKQKNSSISLNEEYITFSSVIISSIEEMRYLAQEKNIEIRFYNDAAENQVFIDGLEIKRVINNLLANAIEYSYKNSYIDVRLYKDADNLICNVKDYGLGINLDKYDSVFDEYVTLSKEQKKIGFGLGLSISKAIIDAHNGTICITSEPQKGTSITVKIPFAPTEITKVEG